ncbi:MAG TPA: AMP-binding protein [Kofleriaceae bacterium]|nr:AMP-binding protein [Kofleriaceae bacterium]
MELANTKTVSEWDAVERDRFVPFRETNIASVVLARAEHPRLADKVHLIVSPRRGLVERRLTFAELARECLRLSRALQREGVRRGARIVLSFAGDWSFIRTFYACQLLGAVPVPVIPPMNRAQVRSRIEQLREIARETQAQLLVTDRQLHTLMEGGLGAVGALRVLSYEQLDGEAEEAAPDVPTSSDVSFIQYTSGSTGGRKGVPATHGHLVANINAIGDALAIVPGDVGVSFLPVYHDMGLIGKVILTACHGNLLCQVPPLSFLRDPAHWLRSIHEHRGTVCAAPPFAYGLCARRVEDADVEGIDLGSWRVAMAAADMIRSEVLDAFAARFAACGFQRRAFLPVYGLAECTLAATMPPPSGPLVTLRVAAGASARELVCVGKPVVGHRVRIASPEGRELPPGTEGEIELQGPSVIDRYWGDAAPRTRDGWLRTGDLGVVTDAGLFISGRTKDVIKVHGRSLQPSDIEWVADEVLGVRRGCSAAFNATASEQVVLVVESRLRQAADRVRLAGDVRDRVRAALGIEIADVVVVPPHTVPKTSSGKTRRNLTREQLEAGTLRPSRRAQAQDLAVAALHLARGGVSRAARTAIARVRAVLRAGRAPRPPEEET